MTTGNISGIGSRNIYRITVTMPFTKNNINYGDIKIPFYSTSKITNKTELKQYIANYTNGIIAVGTNYSYQSTDMVIANQVKADTSSSFLTVYVYTATEGWHVEYISEYYISCEVI